jgi:segregation and condensation protein B
LEIRELQATIEAILFASGDPVSVDKLADVLELEKNTVIKLTDSLMEQLEDESSGVCIMKMDDKYQMCSKPQFGEQIRKMMDIRRNMPLSPASMEVLAIVAYNQPVTKAFVEQIRGVDCSGVLGSLVTKGLIEEKGRLELPGRPLLYGTTSNFLRCFGITSVDYLPPLPEKDQEEAAQSGPLEEPDEQN